MATTGDTTFGALLRRLRLSAGLTQERLAERAGLSAKAVGSLEQHPLRTPRLDTVTRLADALGLDRDERASLLAAAQPASALPVAAGPGEQGRPAPVERATARPQVPGGQDWGEGPNVGALHGRALELAALSRWVVADGCHLVAIVGMGGVGKTALAARLARELGPHFEAVYWRSLRNAPLCPDWLGGAISLVSDHQVVPAQDEEARLRQLLELLRARRSLIVLDNFETVLEPGAPEVGYRTGYEGYGQLLEWLGETGHRSCLLLTSREVPPEVGPRAGRQGSVRALRLGGLDTTAGRALLADRGLAGDAAAWEAVVARYGGNALALQVVGETIAEVFGGAIAAFLAQEGAVFGDVRRLLDGQLARLSPLERAVLDVLAVEREPVDFGTLLADLGPVLSRGAALEAVDALRRRSLLERGEEGATFTPQPVVLEYATDRLVELVADEIARGTPAHLVSHAVIKAQAKDYVRRSQERLIGEPILDSLIARLDRGGVEERLLALLEGWRGRPAVEQGYGPGNAVDLLRLLRGDLRRLDLADLDLRQAYLAGVDAQDASLAGSHLAESVLAEAFDFPGSVALSADGAWLAAGTSTGELRLWRVADRTPLWTVAGHAGGVWGLALSADGRLLASGGADGQVRLWEAERGRSLATLEGHAGGVRAVALSADGRLLASGGADGAVRLWEADGGRLLASLEVHAGGGRAVALSADGHLLATGGFDGTVRLWEAETERLLATLEGHAGGVRAVGLSADGRLVASGGFDGTVRLWETDSGRPLATIEGYTGVSSGVAVSAGGRLVASGSADGTVRLWEAAGGRLLMTIEGHAGGVRAVALSADGRLLASGGFDGTARLWEADTGRPLATLRGHTGAVSGVALSADGHLLASGGYEGTVRLWDVPSRRPLAILRGHTGGVRAVRLSADGRLVASGGFDGTVRLWEAPFAEGDAAERWAGRRGDLRQPPAAPPRGGRPLAALTGHTAGVTDVALSADGRLVASDGFDGTVRLWEAETGRPLATLQGHTGVVWGVALSADGHLLATGSLDGTVRLWEAGSGRLLATLAGHSGVVSGVALSAEGRLLASGGFDGTVRLWEAQRGTCLHTLRAERRYERLDIAGLTGITHAQRQALLALGAVDRGVPDGLPAACPGQPASVPAAPAPVAAGDRSPAGAPSLVEPLSPRELDVLRLLAAGRSNAELAHELVVVEGTVKTHLIHIYDKLGVHSRTQAVARARALGLLD